MRTIKGKDPKSGQKNKTLNLMGKEGVWEKVMLLVIVASLKALERK
jgi:hypothetical protein